MMFLIFIIHLIALCYAFCQNNVGSLTRERSSSVFKYNDKCYVFINEELTWVSARRTCESYHGDMVSIPDEGTMNFLKHVMSDRLRWTNNGVWVGLHDRDRNGWRWTTGDPITYNYWLPGQPSKTLWLYSFENCANMRRTSGWRWDDKRCNSIFYTYKFICQFDDITTTVAPITEKEQVTTGALTTTSYTPHCPSWLFGCRTGTCISISRRCNHLNDCGDNSDEENCRDTDYQKR